MDIKFDEMQKAFCKEQHNFNELMEKTNPYANVKSYNTKYVEQFLDLKKSIKNFLTSLLICEFFFLLLLIIFQGFKFFSFQLNEWSFGLFINGCIVQTFLLVGYMIKHLFPVFRK